MGTEGRRNKNDVTDMSDIPISESIYDFIVFKAADVKNLQVEQPPPVTSGNSSIPDDPAIVGVSLSVYFKSLFT